MIQIDIDVFKDRQMSRYPIGQRKSWASVREATRVEDVAYSLLGGFGVNMPWIYGEGT